MSAEVGTCDRRQRKPGRQDGARRRGEGPGRGGVVCWGFGGKGCNNAVLMPHSIRVSGHGREWALCTSPGACARTETRALEVARYLLKVFYG